MDGRNLPVSFGKTRLWVYVVEQADGLRLRIPLDDWERVCLLPGQLVPIRLPNGDEPRLYVDRVREEPPFVWLTAVRRMLASR